MNKILFFSFIILSSFHCERDDDPDCTGVILCTEEFRSVFILIKHSNDSSPVLLTGYKVVRTSDNKDITITDNNLADNNGYYTVINDNSAGLTVSRNTEVEFQGYINDDLVIHKQFIVTRDCCHISFVSGEMECYI